MITCARGVRDVAGDPHARDARPAGAVYDSPAVVVQVAAKLDEQRIVWNKARRHEQSVELDDPTVFELDAKQPIIRSENPLDCPVNNGDRTSSQSFALRLGQGSVRGQEDDVL